MSHIVLCTYELYPSNRGGCGVVVDALARRLAAVGHRVTVLGDMPEAELIAWRTWTLGQGAPDTLGTAHLGSLVPQPPHRNLFAAKSRQFAEGLRVLYQRDPFDLVEFHEYAGVGFESLRQHRKAGWFAPARVAVRIHGSLELIDREEGTAAPSIERAAMYLMERFSLRAADVVLSPSEGMAGHYLDLYDLDRTRLAVAPPPMDLLLPAWTRQEPRGGHDLLVFGKLQEIKGCALIAEAASSLFVDEPQLPGRVVFVGSDVPCQRHGRPTSECVKSMIAPGVHHRFEFRSHIERSDLPLLAAQARAGVIASRYESFCLAAHELASLGLPLVINSIPAFRGYFSAVNSFPFESSVVSLRQAMRAALVDDARIARIRALPPLFYEDPVGAYSQSLTRPGATATPASELLEQEIDYVLGISDSRPGQELSAWEGRLVAAKRRVVGTARRLTTSLPLRWPR